MAERANRPTPVCLCVIQAFFDAMSTVWHTETVDGQALYGKAFYNIDYFNKYHLSQASSFSCDHMHDGLGFMTQHVALTVKFERALQAVDPSVAMHYWDFTIDGEDIFLNKDGNFSQYWFDAEVRHTTDGRQPHGLSLPDLTRGGSLCLSVCAGVRRRLVRPRGPQRAHYDQGPMGLHRDQEGGHRRRRREPRHHHHPLACLPACLGLTAGHAPVLLRGACPQ